MAMAKCKECGKEVSTKAKVCPHCGVKNPGVKTSEVIVGLLFILAVGFGVVKCSGSTASDTAKPVADIDCQKELQCWGDKHLIAAGVYCKDSVARLAKFDARWTDGTLEPKFSKFRWLDKNAGTLTFIGDKIEFQNGFGAYQAHVYECDFAPATHSVLAVRAQPGRI